MILRIFLILLVLFLNTCGNLPVKANIYVPYISQKASNIKIKNFDKVDDYYYRGSQPNITDIKELSKMGVKTIINLRKVYNFNKSELLEQKLTANRSGINYINIPMSPNLPPTEAQIKYFFSILDNSKNLPVFVHCYQGRDRTGIMTALYRVRYYRWDFDQAYAEMKKHGYHSIIFPELKKFLAAKIRIDQNYEKLAIHKNF